MLVLYALLPIVRSTIVGITGVDRSVREAGVAMGMTPRQLLRQVELPLALPSIVAGIRVAAVVGVGSATIAAAIGAGGLGQYIYRGLSMVDTTVILAGAIPAALLAWLVDGGLLWLERQLSPRGARRSRRAALTVAAALAACSCSRAARPLAARSSGAIVVGSKNFTEQLILGEIVAQTIERETGLSGPAPAESGRHADLRSRAARRRHRRLRRVHRHRVDGDLPSAAVDRSRRRHATRCGSSTPTAAARSCRRSASTTRSRSWCAARMRASWACGPSRMRRA